MSAQLDMAESAALVSRRWREARQRFRDVEKSRKENGRLYRPPSIYRLSDLRPAPPGDLSVQLTL
jgi:hypothetical protein